ncbi:unnamed protein product [Schistosoma mattheei]|uniref:Uncharacterized protein n=1 Tax=Schistosoma mattheei TaxID=31246 RepID=A0A183NP10_9TREM|nr:unnamed protein product [Schistosoma mattheei]
MLRYSLWLKSVSHAATELDSVRPQSAGEEQLHLQLALAISKEEHDREERRRRAEEAKEEAKVQMVIEQSRREEQVITYFSLFLILRISKKAKNIRANNCFL